MQSSTWKEEHFESLKDQFSEIHELTEKRKIKNKI